MRQNLGGFSLSEDVQVFHHTKIHQISDLLETNAPIAIWIISPTIFGVQIKTIFQTNT